MALNLKNSILAISTLLILISFSVAEAYQTRIIGGKNASLNTSSTVVRLELSLPNGKQRLCTGNLISSQWVMTAAHCFYNQQNQQEVFSDNIITYPGLQRLSEIGANPGHGVQTVFIHPQFAVNGPFDFDFALLELSHPVDLPSAKLLATQPELNELATIAGWGAQLLDTETRKPVSSSLAQMIQTVDLPIVSNTQCTRAMGGNVRESMICAGFVQGGKDACSGDSGGPMMVLRNGSYSQVGLVSFGIGCAQPNRYGVYARVTAALPWIQELVPDVQLNSGSAERILENPDSQTEQQPITSQRGDEGAQAEFRQGGGVFSLFEILGLVLLVSARTTGVLAKSRVTAQRVVQMRRNCSDDP